ncbi:MAG: hypothetical protein A3K10_08600 [Bacteroidetes bacterium RIFCSPLOWO2_12_FULL_31_6]|nr:MAG: hypothetical protein A3K10_08600 [Bacteroidetes bacterium RIFCSPLOWO2_12_FULL_31_6]
MKKIIFCLMVVGASLTFQSNATTITTTEPISKSITEEEASILVLRLDEINTIDKSSMSSAEKKELRTEVKSIEKQLRTSNGGIYLSGGAIIIIVILIIILF